MADFYPVAADVKPQDPNQAFTSMNNILGLQSKRQELQIQGQELQQKQLATQQQQGVQNFFQQWDPSEHLSPDGTTDTESVHNSPAYKSAGNAKPLIDSTLIQIKQGQYQNKQSLATLNGTMVKQYSEGMGALANDEDVKAGNIAGQAKVRAQLQLLSQQSPDMARIVQGFGGVLQHAPTDANGNKKNLAHLLQSQQLMGTDILGQRSQQNPGQSNLDTGGQIQQQNRDVQSGDLTPNGPPVSKTLAPQVVTGPDSSLHVLGGAAGGPSASTQAPPSGAPGANGAQPPSKLQPLQRPGWNAPKIDQDTYNSRIQAAGEEYAAVSGAANNAQNGVQVNRYRNSQILDLTKVAPTGPGKDIWNHMASQFGGESGDAFQKIGHYLAQNSASLAKTMGVPNTNMGAETAAASAGNTAQNPNAIKEITKVNDALNTAFDLYNRGLARVTGNGQDFSRAPAYKQAFGAALDVNALRWADAHRRDDKEEIQSMQRQFTDKQIAEFKGKLLTLKSLADKGDLP